MKISPKYYFSIFIILSCHMFAGKTLNAQYYFNMFKQSADTLYPKLSGASDKDKIPVYNGLAFYHSFSSYDSAIYYAEKALHLEEIYPDQIQKANAYRHMGNAYSLEAKYGKALFYLNQALQIFEKQKDYRKIAELYFDLGKLNYDMSDYDRAISYSDKLVALYKTKTSDNLIIASPLEYGIIIGLTGGAAREKKDYNLAYKYFYEYIGLSKQYDFPYRVDAIMILSLASVYELDQKYDSALKYYYEGRSLYPWNRDKPRSQQTGYERDIGNLIFRTGNSEAAIPLLKLAYTEDESDGKFFYATYSTANLGDAYLQLGKKDSALFYYQESLRLSEEMYKANFGSSKDSAESTVFGGYQYFFNINEANTRQFYYGLMNRTYQNLYNYYLHLYDSVNALIFIQKKLPYIDSLQQVTNEIELHKIQARYENERLELQVNNLSIDNENKEYSLHRSQLILTLVGVISFLLISFGVFFFRQNKINAGHEKLQIEQKLLRTQMNPHFIFNSLASVQNFIVKQDDTKASIYLSRFSDLVRSILNNSIEEQITLEEEINTIENYLELQKIRFPEKFSYSIEMDEKLDPENTFVPPMLAQPFIENAIEHGIKHKGSKGNIHVRFKMDKQKLIYEVEDDGIGRDRAQEILQKQNKDHKSLATSITQERIKVLNKKLKHKIKLEIFDLKNEKGEATGTKVIFEVPV
ncbi:MAG: histidine kinase [Bacteroidales bacterium]